MSVSTQVSPHIISSETHPVSVSPVIVVEVDSDPLLETLTLVEPLVVVDPAEVDPVVLVVSVPLPALVDELPSIGSPHAGSAVSDTMRVDRVKRVSQRVPFNMV